MSVPGFANSQQEPLWNILFEWDDAPCPTACGSIDGYKIYQVDGGLIVDTGDLTDPVDGQTVVSNFSIGYGEERCFDILAYNVIGDSEKSDPACITTPLQQVPGKTTLIVKFPTSN